MLRAIVVDDEEMAVKRLGRIITQEGNFILAGSFTDPEEALNCLDRLCPEVVFLDIELPEMSGLELAERLLDKKPSLDIIFVTGYDHYALQAFKAHAVGYVLKPVDTAAIHKEAKNILRRKGIRLLSPGRLQTVCFKKFHAWLGDREQGRLEWRTAKVKEFLAFLLHQQGQPVSRDTVLETLWGNMPADRAAKNLHAISYYLKNHLEERGLRNVISRFKGHYLVEKNAVECDAFQFHQTVEELARCSYREKGLLEKASKIYQGHYMEEDGYSWAIERQVNWEKKYIRIQMKLSEIYSAAGDIEASRQALLSLLHVSPFLEDAHEKLIRIYLMWGDRVSAIRQYRFLEKMLWEDMNLKPKESIRTLIRGLN